MQLDVDGVFERFEVVDLPGETVKIAIKARRKGGRRKAIFGSRSIEQAPSISPRTSLTCVN